MNPDARSEREYRSDLGDARDRGWHSGEGARQRHKTKLVKARQGRSLRTLGRDVTFDMVLGLSKRALLGRFDYVKMARPTLIRCMMTSWKPPIKYTPKVYVLVNGRFCFHLLTEDSLRKILDRYWVVDEGSLVFYRLHVGFNSWKEKIIKRHLWVLLPGFPCNAGRSGVLCPWKIPWVHSSGRGDSSGK